MRVPSGWRNRWVQVRETPFARLVQLSLNRMLHGAHDDSDEIDADVGRFLVLLAIPGAVVSFILFDKYGTLLQYIRGQMHFDPYRESVPDEYFFISLSMAVCGLVAIWKTESIFPDRRDYLNLVPLPVRTRSILLANVCALALFSILFTVDVNVVSGWLFPIIVAASNGSTRDFGVFLFSHLISVGVASIFSFASVFALLGTAMAVLPVAVFRRVSVHVNSAIIVGMLALLATTQSFSSLLNGGGGGGVRAEAVRLLPSFWFVGLCQAMRGFHGGVAELWPRALLGPAVACIFALVMYAMQYRRHFVRTAEQTDGPGAIASSDWLAPAGRILDRLLLRTPFERAAYRHTYRTLARSARHRLVLAGFLGLAAVVSVEVLAGNVEAGSFPSISWLSIGFVLNFCIIIGMRFVFDIPAELKANWTFRLWVEPDQHRCEALARKIILSAALFCVWTAELALYLILWGWTIALLNAVIISLSSFLMTEIVICNFPKIPFTCTYPPFKQGSIVAMVLLIVGFAAFSFGIPAVEHWALPAPWRLFGLVCVLVGAWYGVMRYRSDILDEDRSLIFEEASTSAVEVINLSRQ